MTSSLDSWNARAAAGGYDPRSFVQVEGQWLPVIAGGGSGGGKTRVQSTTVLPGPTAEETALNKKQVELLELQIKEGQRQSKLLEEAFPASQALLKEQLALTTELASFQRKSLERQTVFEERLLAAEETAPQKEIRELSEQRALAILKGEAPPLSRQQEGFIEEIFASAGREASVGLRDFAEELAATRGLKLTDTPIGETVLREGGRLASGLAGAKATAKLDVSQTQQAFQEGVRQFQESLRQQAFLNRLALTGREAPGLSFGAFGAPSLLTGGTGSLTNAAAVNANILDRMQNLRLGGAGSSRFGRGPGAGFDWGTTGALIGGVGALAGGTALLGSSLGWWGAAAPAAGASTAKVKKDIEPLDVDEYERARLKVKDTPVVRFRYKWDGPEDRKHLGILIETSPEEVSRDGTTLDFPGYMGLTLAAVKGVDRRIDRLEARLPVEKRARLPVNERVIEKRRLPMRSAA